MHFGKLLVVGMNLYRVSIGVLFALDYGIVVELRIFEKGVDRVEAEPGDSSVCTTSESRRTSLSQLLDYANSGRVVPHRSSGNTTGRFSDRVSRQGRQTWNPNY